MDVLGSAIARYPEIVSVVMTGAGGVSDAVTAIKRGAVDFLMKPFSLDRLATLLKGALSEEAPSVTMTSRDSGVTLQYDRIIGTSTSGISAPVP